MINYTYILLNNLRNATLLSILIDIIYVIIFTVYTLEAIGRDKSVIRDKEEYKKEVEIYKKYFTISMLVFIILLLLYTVIPSEKQLNLLYNIK